MNNFYDDLYEVIPMFNIYLLGTTKNEFIKFNESKKLKGKLTEKEYTGDKMSMIFGIFEFEHKYDY